MGREFRLVIHRCPLNGVHREILFTKKCLEFLQHFFQMLPVCRRLSVARSSWSCQCQLLALLSSLHAGLNSLVGLPRPREASVVLVVVTEHTTAVTLGHRELQPIPLETAASAAHKSVRVPITGGGGGLINK